MREFVFNLEFREHYAYHDLLRQIDYSIDSHIDLDTFFEPFVSIRLHLLLIASNEHGGHVMIYWQFPFACVLTGRHDPFKFFDNCFGLSCLTESILYQGGHLGAVLGVTLEVDSTEDCVRRFQSFNLDINLLEFWFW